MMRPIYLLLAAGALLAACHTETKKNGTDDTTKILSERSTADSLAPTVADQSLETVAAIQDAYVQTMERLQEGALDSTFFEYDCQGERNGRVVYYSEKGKLLLIKHSYGEYSHHEVDETYFVRDKKPFFQFRQATTWSFDSGSAAEGATRDEVQEQRIYLKDEKPFRCLQKSYVMRSKANDNPIPDKLPNKDVGCASAASTLTSFALLAKYEQQSTTGCLEEQ